MDREELTDCKVRKAPGTWHLDSKCPSTDEQSMICKRMKHFEGARILDSRRKRTPLQDDIIFFFRK